MASDFPRRLDNLGTKSSVRIPHTLYVTSTAQAAADAVMALQLKVGVDNSTDTSSLDWLVTSPNSYNPGHRHTALYNTLGDLSVSVVGSGVTLYFPLTLDTGVSIPGGAPIKFQTGSLLSTPEDGAMEFDGIQFYLTAMGVRTAIGVAGSVAGSSIVGVVPVNKGGTNMSTTGGAGTLLGVQSTGVLEYKTLVEGSNITISQIGSNIIISSVSGGSSGGITHPQVMARVSLRF